MPSSKEAPYGNTICSTNYSSGADHREWPVGLRIDEEVKCIERMLEEAQSAVSCLEELTQPNDKTETVQNLFRFIENCTKSVLHAKEWFTLICRYQVARDRDSIYQVLDEMEQLLLKERKNAEETIPLVEYDSALGYEPSMGYMTDRWHLEWKIRHTNYVLNTEIGAIRKGMALKIEEKIPHDQRR